MRRLSAWAVTWIASCNETRGQSCLPGTPSRARAEGPRGAPSGDSEPSAQAEGPRGAPSGDSEPSSQAEGPRGARGAPREGGKGCRCRGVGVVGLCPGPRVQHAPSTCSANPANVRTRMCPPFRLFV